MHMKYRIQAFCSHPVCAMNMHEVTMIVGIKSMKYGAKIPKFHGFC